MFRGSVENEGVITIAKGSRINDAIEASGGLLEDANLSKINLAFELTDGQKIYIPNNEEALNSISVDTESIEESETATGVVRDYDKANNTKVNINTAPQTLLETLTGIGPSTADKIIKYRKENGKFTNIEDIKNVSGIGDAKYEAIKDFISI